MIGKEITVNVSLFLLLVATVLFVLAAFPKVAKAWMIPVGLACFSGAFLTDRLF